MKIRYQADNDLDQRIVDAVTRLIRESDFKTASEAGFHTGTSTLKSCALRQQTAAFW